MLLANKLKRQLILLMMILFFVGVSATDIYLPSLPQMVAEFKTTPAMVNLTLSAFSLGIASFVLITGEISNRFGRRKILLLGVGVFASCAFLLALTYSLPVMIIFRFIQAFGGAVILIVPRLLLKDCMNEREQIRANGMLLTGLIISPALSPVVGAFLAKWFGWRSCFVVTGILSTIIWGWIYKVLPETNLNCLPRFKPFATYVAAYARLIVNPVFLTLTLIYAGGVAAYFSFIGVSSYLYIKHWHLSPLHYSYIFTALAVAYFSGNQIMQWLNRKGVMPVTIIGIGVYSTLLGDLLMLISYCVWHQASEVLIVSVTVGVVLMRAANALINPPTQIKIMGHFSPHSAQALGLNMCFGFALNSLATYLVTLVPRHPFTSLVVLSSLCVSTCVVMYSKNRHLLV